MLKLVIFVVIVLVSQLSIIGSCSNVLRSTSDQYYAKCGIFSTQITKLAGAIDAKAGQFPSHVSVRSRNITCGGVIIHPFHVLTAGHCFINDHERVSVTSALDHHLAKKVCFSNKFTTIGNGNNSFDRYDIAVIKLKRPIEFGPNVQAACLIDRPVSTNEMVYTVGEGNTESGSNLKLKYIAGKIIGCKAKDEHLSVLCVQPNAGQSCVGDSGAGSFLIKDNRQYLVGQTSYGEKGCSNINPKPHVSTNTYNLREEIKELMQECK